MPRRIPVGPFPHYYAIVDDEDFDYLSQFTWHPQVHNDGRRIYAQRNLEVRGQRESMHSTVTGFTLVDHKNGIGLDNRRENLRLATQSQNIGNARKITKKSTTSRFKGVSWYKRDQIWTAQITFHGRKKQIGRFVSEVEAALAYDAKAVELFGEFARVNFPTEDQNGCL